jgi:hypothetical protein
LELVCTKRNKLLDGFDAGRLFPKPELFLKAGLSGIDGFELAGKDQA